MKTLDLKIDTVLFDIDRTLVDITQSYEQAIRLVTVEYIRQYSGESLDVQGVCSDADIYQLWWRPELADVWYITYAFILYYLTPIAARPATTNEYVQRLLITPGDNWEEIIFKVLGIAAKNNWDKKIAQALFQNYFCGQEWIEREQVYPWVLPQSENGLYQKDQLIGGQDTLIALQHMSQKYALGIATARPRDEALQCINQFGLNNIFPASRIATLEVGSKADRIKQVLTDLPSTQNILYCGDAVSDFKAVAELKANAIFISGIGVNVFIDQSNLMQQQIKYLKAAGAYEVFSNVCEFNQTLLNN